MLYEEGIKNRDILNSAKTTVKVVKKDQRGLGPFFICLYFYLCISAFHFENQIEIIFQRK